VIWGPKFDIFLKIDWKCEKTGLKFGLKMVKKDLKWIGNGSGMDLEGPDIC